MGCQALASAVTFSVRGELPVRIDKSEGFAFPEDGFRQVAVKPSS